MAIRVEVSSEHDDDNNNNTEPPTILLSVSYPETYPQVGPHLDLSHPPNAPKHRFLDMSEDKARLMKLLESTVEENLGMAMVFTLVTTLKESAEQLVIERQGLMQAEKDREAAKAEEEENRKFHGAAVTRESFLKWREKFMAEMAEKERNEREEREVEERKRRGGKPEEKKMSGRQLWEKGLVGKTDEEEEEEEVDDDAIDSLEKLKVAP